MTARRSIYQLHPGAWLRRTAAAEPPPPARLLDQALADTLVPYVRNLGFTHIELLSNPFSGPASPAGIVGVADDDAGDAAHALPRLAARCAEAGLVLLPPGSSAVLVAASEDGLGFDDPWHSGLAAELRRHLPRAAAAAGDVPAAPDRLHRFALLRARMALMWAHPGTKRVAMGSEFAQQRPWSLDGGLDWHLLADPLHEGVQRLLHDLHQLCDDCGALSEAAADAPVARPGEAGAGFDLGAGASLGGGGEGGKVAAAPGADSAPAPCFVWIERDNADAGVLAFSRLAVGAAPAAGADAAAGTTAPDSPPGGGAPALLVAANLSPTAQPSYRFGVPLAGRWVERIHTGSPHYGAQVAPAPGESASGGDPRWPNGGVVVTEPVPWNGHAQSLVLKLPARAALILERR